MSPNIQSWQETIKTTEKGYCVICHSLDLICQQTPFPERPWGTEQHAGMENVWGLLCKHWLAPATPGHLWTGDLGHLAVETLVKWRSRKTRCQQVWLHDKMKRKEQKHSFKLFRKMPDIIKPPELWRSFGVKELSCITGALQRTAGILHSINLSQTKRQKSSSITMKPRATAVEGDGEWGGKGSGGAESLLQKNFVLGCSALVSQAVEGDPG